MCGFPVGSASIMADLPIPRRPFSVKRVPGFTTLALVTYVVLYAPIIILIVFSFNEGTSLAIWERTSLKWYALAWKNDAVQEAAIRSLVIATIAASVATTIATMAA